MSWYILALISLCCYAVQKFLFKVAVEKNCPSTVLNLFFMVTVMVISGVFFIFSTHHAVNMPQLLLYSGANAVLFLCLTLFRYESLKFIPSVVAYPLFDLDNIFIVLLALILFNESLTGIQSIGVILGLIAGYLISQRHAYDNKKYLNFKKGLLFALAAISVAVFLNVIAKYVSISKVDTLLFMFFSYLLNSCILFVTVAILNSKKSIRSLFSVNTHSVIFGICIGITNFFAFYTTLLALRLGPLSIVTIITSLATIIIAFLSASIYKEKVSLKRAVALCLGLISVILLK